MGVLFLYLFSAGMMVTVLMSQEDILEPNESTQSVFEDACDTAHYTVLDDTRRSAGFSAIHLESTELLTDQTLQEGWYRFTGAAGTRMPTDCVQMNMCGTRYPVWMDGRLPADRNSGVMNGCINTEEEGCCNERIKILVRNCGAYYIYHLPRLPRCVRPAAYCTDSGPWVMVFKVMGGISYPDPYELWTSEEALNENIPEASEIGTGYRGHFKSMLVKEWNSLNIAEVRLSLYEAGIEVFRVVFDGSGTDKTSWFNAERIILSPYNDLNASNSDLFDIRVEHQNHRFMMSRGAVDCRNANGWMLMIASAGVCAWERNGSYPAFKYSRTSSATIWDYERAGEAEEMAIFMKTEEAPVCRKKSYQLIQNTERGVHTRGVTTKTVDDNILIPGWYRFDSPAGEEVTHYCQMVGSCGTRYPIWLMDVLSTDSGETVKGTMCVNTEEPGCCNLKIQVLVRNCGGFHIYRLPQLKTDQPAAYCTGFFEWDLVMKGISVPDLYYGNLYKLWASNQSVNADIPEARLMDTTFPEPFKSSLVRNWDQMSIQQVRVSLYKSGREVRRFTFNGEGSDRFSWFSQDRIIETPYTDMTANCTYSDFTIGSPNSRQFFINNFDGFPEDFCSEAEGWLAVTSSQNDCLSRYSVKPSFMYSASDTSVRWTSGLVESADVLAIFVKSPMLVNPCNDRGHKVLADTRRCTDIRHRIGQAVNDKSIQPGWYRFTDAKGASLDMPTRCVELDHCGTHYPIWVDDKLPERPADRKELTACINTEEDGCCNVRISIGALHCGDYFVYALRQIPPIDDGNQPSGYCTESDEWEIVFKLTDVLLTPSITNSVQLWRQHFSLNTDIPEARQLDNTFQGHYKTNHIRLWEEMNINKVKLVIYKDGVEKICLIFDGENTNSLSWFSKEKLIYSPWIDLTPEAECNVFSIEGQYTPPARGTRRWFINKKLSPCEGGSEGWLMIIGNSGFLCSLNKNPSILYSNTFSAELWASGSVEEGDFMAVFISVKKYPA